MLVYVGIRGTSVAMAGDSGVKRPKTNFLLLVLVFLAGCSTAQIYPGAPLSEDEVARIESRTRNYLIFGWSQRIVRVDAVPLWFAAVPDADVLPGDHLVIARHCYDTQVGSSCYYPVPIFFTAEAGHTYKLDGTGTGDFLDIENRSHIWIVDQNSNQAVTDTTMEMADNPAFLRVKQRAERGDRDAELLMAFAYAYVEADIAHRWMCRAANKGHPVAQHLYGQWHLTKEVWDDAHYTLWSKPWQGLGYQAAWEAAANPDLLKPDLAEAYMWYHLAAANGDAGATKILAWLDERLPSEDVELGSRRANDWMPGKCESL